MERGARPGKRHQVRDESITYKAAVKRAARLVDMRERGFQFVTNPLAAAARGCPVECLPARRVQQQQQL